MSEEIVCRLCGSKRNRPRFPKSGLPVHRCLTCDAVFRPETPGEDGLSEYYNEDYYLKDWKGSLGRFFKDFDPDKHHKTRFWKRQLKDLAGLAGGPGRLLDVGAANGVFVWLASEAGWSAEGVEVSAFAAERGREQFGVTIHEKEVWDLPPAPVYDVITLWDTIEHMPHPKQAIHACYQRLKPGGYLAVLTPDTGSLVNQIVHGAHRAAPRLSRRYLEQLYHEDHLTYFDRDTLCLNLIEHGFLIHWIESYDEHPKDTETEGLARLALYCLYPVAGFFNLRHEMLVWAEKPAERVGAMKDWD